MTTTPATRRATTRISASISAATAPRRARQEGPSIAVGVSSGLGYDEPADDAAAEEDEWPGSTTGTSTVTSTWTSARPRSTCRASRTIEGDDSDPTVGRATGFAAKITGNLGDLSLSAGADDVVLTGATDTAERPAPTTSWAPGWASRCRPAPKLDANYIYSTDNDVASDVTSD